MNDYQTLTHVKWDCKYHIVICPKYRKKAIFGQLRKEIGGVLRELFEQKGAKVIEGHAMPDHIHVCVSVPPKHSVATVMGFVKGKSAILIHRRYLKRERNFTGFHFWSRGYCVSTVGMNEGVIREYIRNQEANERREDQLSMFSTPPSGGARGQ